MDFLFDMPIITPMLGFIMRLCYNLVGNVGIAIIIFTLVVRIAMFPLSVKQQKSQAKTQIYAPRLKEIQQKHRGNNAKMQEEMAKLTKEGYNPAAGCLPMILTMLILFGVLGVVYKPMTYFERIDAGQVAIMQELAVEFVQENEIQRRIASDDYPEWTAEVFATPEDATETTATDETTDNTSERPARPVLTEREINALVLPITRIQGELVILRIYAENPEVFTENASITDETHATLSRIQERITLGGSNGINFSVNPGVVFEEDEPFFQPLLLIPILSFLFAAGQMIIMQLIQKKTAPDAVAQMGSMKYMFYFMPIMSLVIAFQFPAGAGFYWAVSAAVGIVQSIIIFKLWPPEKLRAEVEETLVKKGINIDNVVVIEKNDGRKIEKKVSEMSGKEEKEYYRKKLEEARNADLEKYGEIGELSAELREKIDESEREKQEESETGSDVAEINEPEGEVEDNG
jgi:YidC/Oxa1 family membrane protein insertase